MPAGCNNYQAYDLLTQDLRAGESLQDVTLQARDADALAKVFAGCMNVERLMERQVVSGLDLPRHQRRKAAKCVRTKVTAEQVTRTMSLEFQGADNPVFAQLRDELEACLR